MTRRRSMCLVGLALVLACHAASADWRYEKVMDAEQASVTSNNSVEIKSHVDGSVVAVRAELRLVNGAHGTRAWLALDPIDDGFAQISCDGASLCDIPVTFDQGQPVAMRSCYSDGPFPPFQAVMFDTSQSLVTGLHESRSVEIIAPVSDGGSVRQVSFTFSVGTLEFKASNRRDVCEGDFAGDHGAVEP